jgi:predicted PurR-regulated permease PerM
MALPIRPEPRPEVDADPPIRLAAPSLKGVVRIVAIVVAGAIALYLTWRVRSVLRLAVIALFLALVLNPVVDRVEKRVRLPRAGIILAVFVAIAASVVAIGLVLVPTMVSQVHQVAHHAPNYLQDLRHNSTFRHYDDHYHLSDHLATAARALPDRLGKATGSLQAVTVRVFAFGGQLTTVLSIAFLLMLHGRTYVNMALALTGRRETRYRKLVIDVNKAVATYMLGNVAISVLATTTTWLVLTILGVPYALSLGIVIGFFDLIPLVGATIGAIIVGLATATVDFPTATIVWVVFVILYQAFENYVVQPLVYGRSLDVNPLITILAVLAGAALLGILGALLAIPVAAAVQIVLRDWWAHRTPVVDTETVPG